MSRGLFTGISAFPITPSDEDGIDIAAYEGLLNNLTTAKVDSVGVLGTTGNYPYFTEAERKGIIARAVNTVGEIPVIAGIGALRTRDVLQNAELAQGAGAAALLLSPMSYQTLSEAEVRTLYREVSREISVPLCLYDNPLTTKFVFSDELYSEIAELGAVKVVKVPGVPTGITDARCRAGQLRSVLPPRTNIGVSGDVSAAAGLLGGFDVWFSVLGGIAPTICKHLTNAALADDADTACRLSQLLDPIWELNAKYGSLRVTSGIAAELGLTRRTNLPKPLLSVPEEDQSSIRGAARLILETTDALIADDRAASASRTPRPLDTTDHTSS